MAQDVNIMGIGSLPKWASETTLEQLLQQSKTQNKLLQAGFKLDPVALKNLADLDSAIEEAASGIKAETLARQKEINAKYNQLRAEQDIKNKEKALSEQYKQSVDDLRSSLGKIGSFKPESLFAETQNVIGTLGSNLSNLSGSSKVLGVAFKGLHVAVAGASLVFGIFTAGAKTFEQLTDSGVMFGGSMIQMQVSAAKTGLSLESFGSVAGKYATVIGAMGGESFAKSVRNVQNATAGVGRYGQTFEAQADTMADFWDTMRAGGQIYQLNEEQRTQITTKYLGELAGLTELTGKNRKELEAQRKAALQQAAVDLRIRQLRRTNPEAAARLTANAGIMAARGMSPEMVKGMIAMGMGMQPADSTMREMMSITGSSDQFANLAGGMTSDTTEGFMNKITGLRGMMESSGGLDTMLTQAVAPGAKYGAAADMFSKFLQAGDRELAVTKTPGMLDKIMNIFSGKVGNLDEETTDYMKSTGNAARAMGDFRAGLLEAAESARVFATVMKISSGVSGFAAGNPMLTGVGLGVASLATSAMLPMMLKKMFTGGMISKIFSGGGLNALANLTSGMSGWRNLFGGAGGAGAGGAGGAGMGGLLGRVGGIGGLAMRGLGGLGAGAGVGSLAGMGLNAMGASRDVTKWGSILAGAGGGALMGIGGGPLGIALGALAGGLGAWLTTNTDQSSGGDGTVGAGGGSIPTDLVSSTVALATSLSTNTAYLNALSIMMNNVAAQSPVGATMSGATSPFGGMPTTGGTSDMSDVVANIKATNVLITSLIEQVRTSGIRVERAVN